MLRRTGRAVEKKRDYRVPVTEKSTGGNYRGKTGVHSGREKREEEISAGNGDSTKCSRASETRRGLGGGNAAAQPIDDVLSN